MSRPSPAKSQSPSIADVAALAGVSPQTVSRVSREAPNVREGTRQKVRDAMERLGYTPNRAAQALRSGSFHTLGVITQNVGKTGEACITAAIVSKAAARGYSTTIIQVPHPETDDLQEATTLLIDQAVDGIIIIQAGSAARGSLRLPKGVPVSVSDSRLIDDYPCVLHDQVSGVQEAMNYLFDLGHRSIAHIRGPLDSRSARLRYAAWSRALQDAGIPEGPLLYGDWSTKSGYIAGKELAKMDSVTAVLCGNDEMALGLMRALDEGGRKIPDDISVIGFDGIDIGEYSIPPLTTIQQDFDRIGFELVDQVLSGLDGQSTEEDRRIVPSPLIVRASSGPRKK
ncbi:MAG: LacI family DNA-binding transcriptional regulator [Actinomycetaceae bacterium]|nr:LacI family DNA-binding transcriptional regulator [Actinomycetaceae bacterium]